MATIFQRSGVFYKTFMFKGKQVRQSLRTRDEATARAMVGPARAAASVPVRDEWDVMVTEGLACSSGWLSRVFQRTKDRATSKGIPFYLTKEELRGIALRSGGQCEFTGLPFSWERVGSCRFQPYAPSLDRIIPATGYTAGNCRLICYAANVALSDWGADVALTIASAMIRNRN